MTSIDETIDEFGAPADLEHLLVVDQCSAKKAHPDDAPVLDREEIDAHRRGELGFDPPFETPAAELYVGRQQREIGRGVEAARSSDRELDRYFVSAGFGLVRADEHLPPYDCSFERMSDRQIRRRADDLGIAADLREVVGRGDYDCAILALGASGYPSSARIGELVEAFAPETRFVVCDGDQLAESGEGVVTLRIDASDDRPAPAVRGRAVRRFLEWIAGIAR